METEMLEHETCTGCTANPGAAGALGVLRAGPGVTDSEIVIGQSLGLTGPLAAMAPNW